LLAGLCCTPALSQDYMRFPGESADQRTLKTQEQVDELYASGDYKRALFIYEKELAPRGDKYAQYMVGFMHLNGQGVPPDPARALMTPDEIEASNRIFLQLLQEIGDTKLIMTLIQKDMNTLKGRTGTHIPGSRVSSPMQIIMPSGMPVDPNYYSNIRRRLEVRLGYLETTVEISDIELESDNDELRQFEEQIKSELAAIEVP
jgi:hypothetical protein